MANLSGRRILLISPQPWEHLPVSKHHYALELARENQVYFLDPPDAALRPGQVQVHAVPGTGRLHTVRHRLWFFRRVRFHWPGVYRLLVRGQVALIHKALGGPCDLVWCFDPNTFPDLRVFQARRSIFHPVDKLSDPRQRRVADSADLILAPARSYLDYIDGAWAASRKRFLPHGLCPEFAALAAAPLDPGCSGPGQGGVSCGYFGNLRRHEINVPIMRTLLAAHPGVTFHFWGPWDPQGELGRLLNAAPNAVLHGAVAKADLARAVASMDCFFLTYRNDPRQFDRDNPHKVLEFLATGKVVVASRMREYLERPPDWVRMAQHDDDADLPGLFADTLARLAEFNRPELQQLRRRFALENSYRNHVAQVAEWLGEW
ncbi:MAG: glycosyltransferase [Magnetococcus sp. WYHC-3]